MRVILAAIPKYLPRVGGNRHRFGRPGRPRRNGRHVALAILAVAPIFGAALGAGTHVASGNRFVAEAAVVVLPQRGTVRADGPRGGFSRTDAILLTQMLELNPTLQRLKQRLVLHGSLDEIRARVDLYFDLNVNTMSVVARDRSPGLAQALANAVGNQAVDLIQQLRVAGGRTDLVIGDFELGLGKWTSLSEVSVPPDREELVAGGARYGRRWLRVACARRSGCGPSATIEYPFRAGVRYVASAWLRSSAETKVALLFGNSSRDIASTLPARLSSKWERVTVTWAPRADASRAEVTLLSRGARRRTTFGVDGVLISDPRSSPAGRSGTTSLREEATAMRLARRVATVVPAQSRGSVQSDTLAWTLGGAVFAFLVVSAGIAAAWLADKRRRRQMITPADPPTVATGQGS